MSTLIYTWFLLDRDVNPKLLKLRTFYTDLFDDDDFFVINLDLGIKSLQWT